VDVTAHVKKILFVLAGILSVVTGTIGAFVPLLPTVPFLLLAAFFFAKSSPRLYNWLHTNRWFGKILRDYKEGKGMPRSAKIFSILLMWLVVGYSLYTIESPAGKVIMLVVGIGVTIHLLMLKSYKENC
jgi:uncharacterized membrane protein YbaN (DUF454 family)